MQLRFPLPDVKLELCLEKQIKAIEKPLYEDDFHRLNQNEFSMRVQGVGSFYASGGNYVSFFAEPYVTKENIELYLNGSTYGAILHQRKILPLHGSCFVYNNKGIMLCGNSGAGKSSLTAAFVLEGNDFLTDDITPVRFVNNEPHIWTISDRIKLWEDSLNQLNQSKKSLNNIDPETEKYYFPINSSHHSTYKLDTIFLIEIHQKPTVDFREIAGAEKVTALRNEIYRLEYMLGMPENEIIYFKKLSQLSRNIRLVKLSRPSKIPIFQVQQELKNYLN